MEATSDGWPKAIQRNVLQKGGEFGGIVQEVLIDGRFNSSGGDGVYGDAQRSEFDGKIAGQHFDAALAGTVRREVRERQLFVDRTDVDNFASGFSLLAMVDERLGQEEKAFQIYIQHGVIVGFGDIPEIVRRSRPALLIRMSSLPSCCAASAMKRWPSAIFPTSHWIAVAWRPCFFNAVDHFICPRLIGTVADGDVGAVLCQAFGYGAAYALITSCNGDGLSFQTIGHVSLLRENSIGAEHYWDIHGVAKDGKCKEERFITGYAEGKNKDAAEQKKADPLQDRPFECGLQSTQATVTSLER